MGVPPTGGQILEAVTGIYRMAKGKMAQDRGFWDRADTRQEPGLMPADKEILSADEG